MQLTLKNNYNATDLKNIYYRLKFLLIPYSSTKMSLTQV